MMFNSNDKERQRANVGDLYTELTACDSFKDFFIFVCKEKIVRDREGLNELINLVNDDYFKIKYGRKTIVYLCDCITTEKMLPIKLSESYNYCEKKMQTEIINNFSKLFPNMEFVGIDVLVKGIGRIDILAKKDNRYVIMELKSGSKNPNTQLLAYANHYDDPILIGITEKEINDSQKLNNIEYLIFDELKRRVDIWLI